MYFAHGHYISISDINIQPSITEREAMESFARYKNIPLEDVVDFLAKLIIKEIPAKTDTVPMLVYKIYLYADYRHNMEIGFIDAHTRKVVFTEPALIDFSASGTFETRYSGTQQGITHYYQGGYHLVDSTRSAVIHTWNLEGRTDFFNPVGTTNAVELIDYNNAWTQTEHRSNNNDMGLDVHWALQKIYDRLYNTHNINSMDENGFTVNAYIRDGYDTDNAFWNPNRQTLSFGEGGSNFRSLASVDVVAHEFGHGITHFQIEWNSTTDQRAFNEGMSDIWGIIMEDRIRPNSVWQIGEQLTKNYDCLRNIQNTNASNTMTQIANTFGSTQYNSGDSYVRGGVFSHWFYLLVNGGTGTNDLGRNYAVYGVGMDQAENLIVKAVFDGYLRNTTSYSQISTSIVNAAKDLAGANSFLTQEVENAWYAVGVGDTKHLYFISGPATVCSNNTTPFVVLNIPENLPASQIVWSYSSNLQPEGGNMGNNKVFKALNQSMDTGWIQATINGVLVTEKKEIYVGFPPTISAEMITIGRGQVYTVTPPNNEYTEDILDYSWTWESNPGGSGSLNTFYKYATVSFGSLDVYTLFAKAINACGVSPGPTFIYNFNVVSYLRNVSVYPNPVSNILNIEIREDGDEAQSKEFTIAGAKFIRTAPTYTIRLYNDRGNPVRQLSSDGQKTELSVSDLAEGFYFLHVYDSSGDRIDEKKIVVQH